HGGVVVLTPRRRFALGVPAPSRRVLRAVGADTAEIAGGAASEGPPVLGPFCPLAGPMGPVHGRRSAGEGPPDQARRVQTRPRMSDRQDPPQGYRPRILVAEDDPDLRRLFGMTLEREGYRVEDDHTGSGLYERLVRLRAEGDPPALILSDVHLPGIDGLRLLECVRSWGWTLPVVMVSG